MNKQYGGSATDLRRANGLRYAHRLAKRNNQLFYWVVVGTSPKRGGGRTELPGVVGFATHADRERGIAHFTAAGANHFTLFRDVNATFALQLGRDPRRKRVVVNR